MSSNGHETWDNHGDGVQRGPSFEDPTQPSTHASPPPPSETVPEQSWDQAWGTDQWAGQTAQDGSQLPQAYPYPPSPDAMPHGSPAVGQAGAPWGGQHQAEQNPYAAQPYADVNPYSQSNPYAQSDPYQQAYGSYAPYGTYAYAPSGKSKVAAALLAFFLGSFGAHSFYLNQKTLGFVHLGMASGSFLITVISAVLIGTVSTSTEDGLAMLLLLAWLMAFGNGIWALVEFVMILIKPEHELGR